jgi:hypothetical protein
VRLLLPAMIPHTPHLEAYLSKVEAYCTFRSVLLKKDETKTKEARAAYESVVLSDSNKQYSLSLAMPLQAHGAGLAWLGC